MNLKNLIQGENSVLYDSNQTSVLYEKLSNTVHVDRRDSLVELQKRIEVVDYRPIFETKSLRKNGNDPLSVLLLEITEKCNLGCYYCVYSKDYPNERPPSPKEMSFDTAKKAIDELVPLSKRSALIGFYGGEPLLNMDLIRKTINYSKKSFPSKEFTFSVTTNFVHADRYIQDLVDNKMYINLSLDGPKEVHDKSRRTKKGEPTYNTIISNLEKIEEYSPGYIDSHIFVLSTCDDPNDLPKIVEFFNKGNYFVTHINSPDPKGRVSQNKPIVKSHMGDYLREEFRKKILQGEDPKMLRRLFDSDLKAMALRDTRVMPQELMLNGSCYPGRKRIFVDINGNYHPCERFGDRLKIGSVDNQIQQNLIDEAIKSFASIRNNLCGDCWSQRVCSPCLQSAKDPKGEISLEGLSQTCEGKRKQLLFGLDNYVKLIKLNKQRTEDYVKNINPLFERG